MLGGMDIWALNTNAPWLFDRYMLHFSYIRENYEIALLQETTVASQRHIVDVTNVELKVHQRDEVQEHDRFMHSGTTFYETVFV